MWNKGFVIDLFVERVMRAKVPLVENSEYT